MSPKPVHRPIRAAVIAASAALIFALAACSGTAEPAATGESLIDAERCEANADAGTITYVNPFGFGSIQLVAAMESGWFEDFCLDVQTVTDTSNSVSLVSAGTAAVTQVGAASNAIMFASGGSNVTAVATAAFAPIFSLVTAPEITDLKQLEGGTFGYHTTIPAPITQMLVNEDVDIDSIEWINDNTYNPTLVTTGQFDGIQAYRSNEPLTLEAQGFEFNQFFPEDYGVSGTTNAWIWNTDFLADHRTAVQDFMRVILYSENQCADDIDACMEIIGAQAEEQGVDYDVEHQGKSWMIVRELMEENTLDGKGIGQTTPGSWEGELEALIEFDQIAAEDAPDLTKLIDSSILDEIYEDGVLVWPGTAS